MGPPCCKFTVVTKNVYSTDVLLEAKLLKHIRLGGYGANHWRYTTCVTEDVYDGARLSSSFRVLEPFKLSPAGFEPRIPRVTESRLVCRVSPSFFCDMRTWRQQNA